MAIYTRYGTQVTIVGKSDLEGWTIISYDDGSTREVHTSDLKADNGAIEINEAIAALEFKYTLQFPHYRTGEWTTAQSASTAKYLLGYIREIELDYNWRIVRTSDKVVIASKYVKQDKPTVDDCKQALLKSCTAYVDIYPARNAIAQIEKYGKLEYCLERLRNFGFECTGEQDYMDDVPYSLIQITKLPNKGN